MVRDEVVVVAGGEEAGAVLSDLILLLPQVELLLQLLKVSHFSRASVDALVIELLDTARIFDLSHATIGNSSICSDHDSILVSNSHDACTNIDST